MAKVFVIANQKGGVGKTTTTHNLGAALSMAGHKTLLIDLDPQANLTDSCGIDTLSDKPTTMEVLDGHPIMDAITPVAENLEFAAGIYGQDKKTAAQKCVYVILLLIIMMSMKLYLMSQSLR